MKSFEKGDTTIIDTGKMRSEIVPIFLCILLITNISSGLIYLLNVRSIYDPSKYLQIPYVYADIIDNSSSSTEGSLISSQTLSDNNGQGPPPGEGQGPPPGEGQGPPCDPLDPSCGTGHPPTPTPTPTPTPEKCDHIDNNGDGQIDEGCQSGGPPPPTAPHPGQPNDRTTLPIDDKNKDIQFNGNIVPVLGNGDSQTILGTAFRNNLLPIQAAAELSREDNCNDGQDNNHNGLRDSEDPSCGAAKISSVGFEGFPSSIPYKNSTNASKSHVLKQSGVTSVSPLISQQNNTSVISISGEGKHDIRTISSFHYRYSPEKLTIEIGSLVVWINQDPEELHGINLIDKISGKTVFSYPIIRSGESAYYQFQEAGQFTYSDPIFPSMTGEITAVS